MTLDLGETINLFIEGKSVRTRQTYLSLSKNLDQYITLRNLALDDMKPIHVKEFISQQGAMNTKATFKRFLSALFRFIGKEDLVEYMKTSLKEVKTEEKFAVDLTLTEILTLIDTTDKIEFKFAWSLGAFDGLRHGEILGLYFGEIDSDERKIILRKREGKNTILRE